MALEDYEIIKELGRGGMGAVYLAHDKLLNRDVAIKILTLDNFPQDDEVRQDVIYNFKREAIAISNLNHPNIVNVYDIGQTKENNHYIIMELLDGQPLDKLIKNKNIDPVTALDIGIQISRALSYSHQNNVIHRDIKPENIIFSERGVAKLTDFGIAKFVEDNTKQSSPGSVVGTILYMSPEQLQSPDSVDGRADMYSFAVSLYQILTSILPTNGQDIRQVIMNILNEIPIPINKINPNLPESLAHILSKAMEKDKEKRYANIEEFEAALREISEYKNQLDQKFGTNDTTIEKTSKLKKKRVDVFSKVDLSWIDNI